MRYRIRGQSLVEFALVVPLLIIIVMGIIDFGHYIYTYSELENATRRASEFVSKAAPKSTSTDCINAAKDEAFKNVFLSDRNSISILIPTYKREIGQPVQVQLSYTNTFMTPVARRILGPTFTFTFKSQRTVLGLGPALTVIQPWA